MERLIEMAKTTEALVFAWLSKVAGKAHHSMKMFETPHALAMRVDVSMSGRPPPMNECSMGDAAPLAVERLSAVLTDKSLAWDWHGMRDGSVELVNSDLVCC